MSTQVLTLFTFRLLLPAPRPIRGPASKKTSAAPAAKVSPGDSPAGAGSSRSVLTTVRRWATPLRSVPFYGRAPIGGRGPVRFGDGGPTASYCPDSVESAREVGEQRRVDPDGQHGGRGQADHAGDQGGSRSGRTGFGDRFEATWPGRCAK